MTSPFPPAALSREPSHDAITTRKIKAILFDLDGVLATTARIHAACWKQAFDEFLKRRSERTGKPFRPFDAENDYRRFVDGKPRNEGVRGFLESRGISLPEATESAESGEESISGLANRKDKLVEKSIRAGNAHAYPGSVAFVHWVRGRGLKTAVVSSSHHCLEVLRAIGIDDLFDVHVDGQVLDQLHLAGKPAPDTFVLAAKQLGVRPEFAAVVEDALVGVEAGRAGGFGLVVGVDRVGQSQELARHGADLVVADLGELIDRKDGGLPR